MSEYNIAPDVKSFNPAELVYYNKRNEMALDLDARLAWFYHVHKGWRLTLDGTRIFGMEVYVNNEYENEEDPTQLKVVREKEIQYQAVGMISMLNDQGVRVTTVGINVDASDPDFMGRLFEQGAYFLLDMSGFSPYNISAEQWQEAAQHKEAERNRLNVLKGKIQQQNAISTGTTEVIPEQVPTAAPSMVQTAEMPSNITHSAPESLTPQEFISNIVNSQTYDLDDVKKMYFETLDEEQQKECADPSKLTVKFDKFCIVKAGDGFMELTPEDQKGIVDNIQHMLEKKKR